MKSILYSIVVILIIGWFLGFFVYNLEKMVHLPLGIAFIVLLFIQLKEDVFSNNNNKLNNN